MTVTILTLDYRIEQLMMMGFHKSLRMSRDSYRNSITYPNESFIREAIRGAKDYELALVDPRFSIERLIGKIEKMGVDLIPLIRVNELQSLVKTPMTPYWIMIRLDQTNKGRLVETSTYEIIKNWRGLNLQEALHYYIEQGIDDKSEWNYLILGSSFAMTDTPYAAVEVERGKYKNMRTPAKLKEIADTKWNGAPVLQHRPSRQKNLANGLWIGYDWFSSELKLNEEITPLTKS